MAVRGLVASIIKFLTKQLEEGDITDDSRESLEVAVQCLESSYNVQASEAPADFDLLGCYKNATDNMITLPTKEATLEEKEQADKYKNTGNYLMKENKISEAIVHYTKAIELDCRNAVYHCNRAAAYSKLNHHHQAIKDCQIALKIDPSYSKAYGRMGLAYSSLEKHKEAKECYQKALEMEPDNESYKNNLQLTEEKIARPGTGTPGVGGSNAPFNDIITLLSDPTLVNMTTQVLSDPGIHNVMTNFMSGRNIEHDRIEDLIEAGQQLAQQVRNVNPEFLELFRRQLGGNTNNPDPPQQN